ncbi:MAG: GNAT family N-acetyltransferase [bacterium]
MRAERGEFTITADPDAVDLVAVHAFLTHAYWSEGIAASVVARAIAGSIPFSLFHGAAQVGFARVITDRATYGYLADVYVLEGYRGQGLGQWLIECIMRHPDLQSLRRFGLVTRDAHDLYRKAGFSALSTPDRHMEIVSRRRAIVDESAM